jgi:hypothetical protein
VLCGTEAEVVVATPALAWSEWGSSVMPAFNDGELKK